MEAGGMSPAFPHPTLPSVLMIWCNLLLSSLAGGTGLSEELGRCDSSSSTQAVRERDPTWQQLDAGNPKGILPCFPATNH